METAQGRSALLRGEAEQEAITILAKSLEKDPDFYDFRRSLEAYKVFMDSQTTVILDPDSVLLKFLSTPNGGGYFFHVFNIYSLKLIVDFVLNRSRFVGTDFLYREPK